MTDGPLYKFWLPEDFPEVDPEEMARRDQAFNDLLVDLLLRPIPDDPT